MRQPSALYLALPVSVFFAEPQIPLWQCSTPFGRCVPVARRCPLARCIRAIHFSEENVTTSIRVASLQGSSHQPMLASPEAPIVQLLVRHKWLKPIAIFQPIARHLDKPSRKGYKSNT